MPLDATCSPQLAVLRAIVLARTSKALAAARVAVVRLGELDPGEARYYLVLIYRALSSADRKQLEAEMEQANPKMDTSLVRKLRALGRQAGKAASVLGVLKARGLPVPDSVRDQVLACRDRTRLNKLLARAVTCASDDELLG